MVTARTIGTLIVITVFFVYIAAANIYIQTTYLKGKPAVPIQQIQQITTITITTITIVVIVAIAASIIANSRRILGIIPFKDVQRHLLLLGPTGAGKTTIAKTIIKLAVRKNVRVSILDWKAGAPGLYIGGRSRPPGGFHIMPGRSRPGNTGYIN